MRFSRCLTAVAVTLSAFAFPSCTDTVNVTEIWASLDEDGARRRDFFYTDTKKIYCIAEVGIGRDNLTVEWIARRLSVYDPLSNNILPVDMVRGYREERPSKTEGQPGKLIFEVSPYSPSGEPDEALPFEAGMGQCELYFDGELVGKVTFEIKFPPCPPAKIEENRICLGFYPEGTVCPAFGESAQKEPTCTCTQGLWKC